MNNGTGGTPHDGAAAMARFNPTAVRYVKLGRGGDWSAQAFADQIIPFGFREVGHETCLTGDWDAVRRDLIGLGKTPGGAGQWVSQIRAIYEQGADCLWFTIADGHLHWAFAEPEVVPVAGSQPGQPSRYRVVDGWRRESLAGEPLTTRSLSSALLRTASFRATICKVEHEEYLLRRIRGEADPLHRAAVDIQAQQETLAVRMIAQLDWRDFETLVDLILTRSGWRRGSNVGDGEVDVDMLLDNPSTGETAWVQVKSKASQTVLDDYLERFTRDGSAHRFFFVCHTPNGLLNMPPGSARHLWSGTALAAVAIRSGLFEWLIERTR